MAEAVALSPDEAKQAEKRLMEDPGIEGPMREAARALTPAIGAARLAEATQQTRLALLKAAIAVRQHGPDVLKRDAYRDPFGTGPFAYSKTDSGFTLQAALIDRNGQAVTLRVGRP
ncbi:MAG: hypothetical protein A2V70_05590 [Planctomycetes bacterium RBG_13_63_9]|nr:MAG: hypothetical protein A2V70_05590 [Planctomycetes bacterium RBG_13_63_9]